MCYLAYGRVVFIKWGRLTGLQPGTQREKQKTASVLCHAITAMTGYEKPPFNRILHKHLPSSSELDSNVHFTMLILIKIRTCRGILLRHTRDCMFILLAKLCTNSSFCHGCEGPTARSQAVLLAYWWHNGMISTYCSYRLSYIW